MDKNMKITVVCGGTSTERDVSLRSGAAVCKALQDFGYEQVTLFDLTAENPAELLLQRPDVVYVALHGKGGEDGTLQGMLELAGIPYTGPGTAASAICMNKIRTKQVVSACGIPTASYTITTKSACADRKSAAKLLVEKIGLPMVLKSPCQGSSIGVVMVHSEEEMEPAMEEIFRYGNELLAEEFLTGTEVTLPIIGNDELTILPEIEITSEREFYDYKAKYTSGLCHHIIPARISENDREAIRTIGAQAYRAVGCVGLSRIDFIIDEKKGPMLIEINTCPGMTAMSLVPDSAASAGISFGELADRIIRLGLETVR